MEHKYTSISVDELTEIIVEASDRIEPLPFVSPPLGSDTRDFLRAIDQAQRRGTRRSLDWAEIFDVIVSLGHRKGEKPAAPPLPPPWRDKEGGGSSDEALSNEKPT